MTDKIVANLINKYYKVKIGILALLLQSRMIINNHSIPVNKSRANIDSAFLLSTFSWLPNFFNPNLMGQNFFYN